MIEPNKHEHIKTFGNGKQPNANRLMHSFPLVFTSLTALSNTQAQAYGATDSKAWQ